MNPSSRLQYNGDRDSRTDEYTSGSDGVASLGANSVAMMV